MENVYSFWLFTSYAEKPLCQRLCKSLGKQKCLLVSSLWIGHLPFTQKLRTPNPAHRSLYYDVNNLTRTSGEFLLYY